ncbi:hypothetical protein Ndes2526B_g02387 [Nannochloris sp. 'desiccata']|nr:hypothetical protein KSW81_003293 [Chlorella desiccata (nom. nud.)]KAH7623087.1 hypothetical protein NADE_007951 [Chlorella desiccata (nom. nud.)]
MAGNGGIPQQDLNNAMAAQQGQGSQFTSPGASAGTNTTGGHSAATIAAINARVQGKIYATNFYRIAWKDTLQHARDLYPDAKAILDAVHTRVQAAAVEQLANPQGLQTFTVAARRELTSALGQRAQSPIDFFIKRLKLVQTSGNPDGQHTHRQNAQDVTALQQQQAQQAQGQQQRQQQQYNAQQQQQFAQQQQAQAQQQQYYQQQLMAQQHGYSQHQQPSGIQPVYNPANAGPAAVSAGMYAHQQQAGMMMNPVVTSAPGAMAGAHPQLQHYAAGTNLMTAAQQQQLGHPQRHFQAGSPVPPAAAATNSQGGKPPKAPKGGKRAAEGEAGGGGAGGDGEGKSAPKRVKAAAAPRKKKAQDSDADEDVADKIKVGDELLVDLQAETDAAMEGIGNRRTLQLPTVPGGQSWDDGYQYLSAWRLTNEVLLQRKEKMPGAAALSGAAGVVDFLEPSTLRALQLGFTSHAAEVMRRAAQAAKHRASSSAAQRRQEFVASGEDARRGLGDIRRAAEKIAADKAALEREELMKKAQSKRADEETRERAQKARAEMAGQQQASAANKAIAATLGGGKGAKWSKWSGIGAAGAAAGKTKEKGAKGDATADKTSADGDGEGGAGGLKNLATSRSRGDLGSAAGGTGAANNVGSLGAGTSAVDASGLESTDIQLQDLIVALQQDPTYCKSMLLYRLLNGLN